MDSEGNLTAILLEFERKLTRQSSGKSWQRWEEGAREEASLSVRPFNGGAASIFREN